MELTPRPVLSKEPPDGLTRITLGLGWDARDVTDETNVDIDVWYIDIGCYEVTLPRGKAGGQIVFIGDRYASQLVMRRLACFKPRMRSIEPPADLDLGTLNVSVLFPDH